MQPLPGFLPVHHHTAKPDARLLMVTIIRLRPCLFFGPRNRYVVLFQKNANSRGVKYDVTMWADLTREEFKSYQNYGKVGRRKAAQYSGGTSF